MYASSVSETPLASSGVLRNQNSQAVTQATPAAPRMKNGARQFSHATSQDTSVRPNAAPSRDPPKSTPWAMPVSRTGSQDRMARAEAGNAPASAAPNKKRMPINSAAPLTIAVVVVSTDQAITTAATTRRGPKRSAK